MCGAGGIRTHTATTLNRLPLPLGYGPAFRGTAYGAAASLGRHALSHDHVALDRGARRIRAGRLDMIMKRGSGSRPRDEGSDVEIAAQLGDVAGGLDVVERLLDLAGLVHDECRADNAGDLLAV
jgi:hypothetical protein